MSHSTGETRVYLVGAGPGDPGLLTLKGRAAIERADVLVYDRLVSPRLLGYARPDCELVYVGKTPDHHTLPQHKINALLVKKALAGNVVVRLKGGDPFVFGRGGEEAEELRDHGLPYEVVPGVTSAIAAPAYAGIPVTHRDAASSFTVITGHERDGKGNSAIPWGQVARLKGTLVFLMGMENLPRIVDNLVGHGMDPATPAAVVRYGTWPMQRTVCAPLASLEERVGEEGIENPAVIVVGQVAALRERLSWAERKPLFGKTVVVTRARHQASALASALEERGAQVLEFPAIEIAPPTDPQPLAEAVAGIEAYRWVVLTSANGVDAFSPRPRPSASTRAAWPAPRWRPSARGPRRLSRPTASRRSTWRGSSAPRASQGCWRARCARGTACSSPAPRRPATCCPGRSRSRGRR